jgi:hypothetical protein
MLIWPTIPSKAVRPMLAAKMMWAQATIVIVSKIVELNRCKYQVKVKGK